MGRETSYRFHLFLSYTRTPNSQLAREVERFLESFHQVPALRDRPDALPPLEVCIDSSDFSMPPLSEEPAATAERDVMSVVLRHLSESRELLLFCSERAARSPWVAQEVDWFLENRGPQAIRLALTEGDRPMAEPERYLPESLRRLRMENNIAYDLRGYDERRSAHWHQVADYKRELVRLAADLHQRSAGELYPAWLEAELERARSESLIMASGARFETLAGDPAKALLKAYAAYEIHPGEETEAALRSAYKVAMLHHYNRRETAQFSGAGPR